MCIGKDEWTIQEPGLITVQLLEYSGGTMTLEHGAPCTELCSISGMGSTMDTQLVVGLKNEQRERKDIREGAGEVVGL